MANTHRDKLNAKRKRGQAPPDYLWLWREPSWWHRMTTTTPARQKERHLLHKVERGDDPDGHWPDRRKPHIYYW